MRKERATATQRSGDACTESSGNCLIAKANSAHPPRDVETKCQNRATGTTVEWGQFSAHANYAIREIDLDQTQNISSTPT